jgi:hypothetical protein
MTPTNIIINQEVVTEYSDIVELPIDSSTNTIKFPNINEKLEKGRVKAIIVLTDANVPFSPTGRPNAAAGVIKRAFLNLKVDNTQKIEQFPLSLLAPDFNNGIVKKFKNIHVSLANSEIRFGDTTGITPGSSLLFYFIYEKVK